MPAAPTLDTIRSAIVTAVKAAMNPGSPGSVTTVHSFRRFWRDEAKFRSLFLRPSGDLLPGKLNGWMITRLRTREEETDERWRFYQIHLFVLEGYMGTEDKPGVESEKLFQDQIEAIRDNLRLNVSVFGNTERTRPVVQVEQVADEKTFGEATMWKGILTLEAEAIETKFL